MIETLKNIEKFNYSDELKIIIIKVFNNLRISTNEGLYLYQNAELPLLSALANYIKERKFNNKIFFNMQPCISQIFLSYFKFEINNFLFSHILHFCFLCVVC